MISEGALEGLLEPADFLMRMQKILGGRIDGSNFSHTLNFQWETRAEAREIKADIQKKELQLRHLRSDVVITVRQLNAAVDGARASGLSAAQKALIRQDQLKARQGYDDIKRGIDSVLLQLRDIKRALIQ